MKHSSDALARTLALLAVAVVIGVGIRYNAFAGWATDSGAYISAGHAWAEGTVFRPASFVFWAPWSLRGNVEAPLGHTPGPIDGTITGMYPLGYPLLLAAAIKLAGPLAAHVVVPLTAGLLVWCAFVLGRSLSTPWAGVLAATLIGGTPVMLRHAIVAMSDVPAAAFWALSWVFSIRTGLHHAAAAGLAAAMAVMIRPNLAPQG